MRPTGRSPRPSWIIRPYNQHTADVRATVKFDAADQFMLIPSSSSCDVLAAIVSTVNNRILGYL
jgi:hypothetical protein